METNDFKGIPGGDPTRRPVKVLTQITCEVCTEVFETMVYPNKEVYPICSEPCKNRRKRLEVIEELRKYDVNLELNRSRTILGPQEILQTCQMIDALSNKKRIYGSGKQICSTCARSFSYFSAFQIQSVRNHCSEVCKKNRNVATALKSRNRATMCPRPEKVKYASKIDAQQKLDSLENVKDFRDTDAVVYFCPCSAWHYGSSEKKKFQDEENAILAQKQEILKSLISQRSHLVIHKKKKNPSVNNTMTSKVA